VPRQGFWQTERDPGDGITHQSALLIHKIFEEEAYRLQVARDRLRRSSLSEEMIDINSDLLVGQFRHLHRLFGNIPTEIILGLTIRNRQKVSMIWHLEEVCNSVSFLGN